MTDIFNILEDRTQAWNALGRQGVADALWSDYVRLRFGGTGNGKALEFLYPYLNNGDRSRRLKAITVAGRVFQGQGPDAIPSLNYFTANPENFIRDRAVLVVGDALAGYSDEIVLDCLEPYLSHKNFFIRTLAVQKLGRACRGQASKKVFPHIKAMLKSEDPGRMTEVGALAIAQLFQGNPNEEVYQLIVKGGLPEFENRVCPTETTQILFKGANKEWLDRVFDEFLRQELHAEGGWNACFSWRDAMNTWVRIAPDRGMAGLRELIHLKNKHYVRHDMLSSVPRFLFGNADIEENRGPLSEMVRDGDFLDKRIATACLGHLMKNTEDQDTLALMKDLCNSPDRALQAQALLGMGLVARSSCDEEIRTICLDRAGIGETARAAIHTLGMLFLGIGRSDVLEDLKAKARDYRDRPVKGKKHFKPLTECYCSAGLVYLGTGSSDPIDFLLDVMPDGIPDYSSRQNSPKRWESRVAGRALTMIQFSERALIREFDDYASLSDLEYDSLEEEVI